MAIVPSSGSPLPRSQGGESPAAARRPQPQGSDAPKAPRTSRPAAGAPAPARAQRAEPAPDPEAPDHRLVDPEATAPEAHHENTLRPKSLSEYIGQRAVKEALGIAIAAAKQRSEPLDHLLLYGPPGLGKTSLSMILSGEMEAQIRITSAPALERPRDIAGLLISLQPGDILFIDEIHRLNRLTEEILYPAMEDFTLDITIGKAQTARIRRLPLPRFTLIGATTKAGSLTGPLRDRFGHVHRLAFYETEDLAEIIRRSADLLDVPIDDDALILLASRSRGTPRVANRLLKRVRDYAQVHGDGRITAEVVGQAFTLLQVDERGLDQADRQLLSTIISHYGGGPVGVETLAAAIGEDPDTIEDVYEPYLLQAGLLQRTPRGRMVTPAAFEHLGQTAPGKLF